MPKTSFSQLGMLILNTGIIDPGYSGLVSTIAINFSRDKILIKKGCPFLRIVFHELHGEKEMKPDQNLLNLSSVNYIKERAKESRDYPSSFLDVPEQIIKVSDQVISKLQGKVMFWFTGITLIIGAFAVFLTIINSKEFCSLYFGNISEC